MARKSNHTFVQSKMNKDLDARLLNAGEYRDGVNVSVSRSESDDVGALENILGNEFLSDLNKNTQYPVEAIGWCIDVSNDRVFVFVTDYQDNSLDKISNNAPFSSYHAIVHFDIKTKVSTTIVSGYFLNFSINSKINDSNLIESLLFWTDNRNQPRKINVETAIADNNYYYNEDHISVAKYYPYKALDLTDKISLDIDPNGVDNQVFLVSRDIGTNGAIKGYESIYPYFVCENDNLPNDIINKLKNNIGLKGYVERLNVYGDIQRWEFRLAWFQKDGEESYLGTQSPERLPSGWNGKYIIFVDRDFDNGLFQVYDDYAAKPEKYNMYFVEETEKNVSSPWVKGNALKLQADQITLSTVGTLFNWTGVSDSNNPYLSTLHLYGTRSTNKQVYDEYNTGSSLEAPTFCIENGFPNNTGGAENIYPRVNHPKLNQNNIYVITKIVTINGIASGFHVQQLNSINNSNGLIDVNLTSVLSPGDILTVELPNKYYSSDFPGDPVFLEDKFIRFAYRFKFDDGEYSIVSPFTQEIFIPKQEGYFLSEINNSPLDVTNFNKYRFQIQEAGENTEVDWFVNKITSVNLKVPLEFKAKETKDKLKVQEIDILYKESDGIALKVVKTLDIDEYSDDENYFISYEYNSEKPIKTVRSSEITRVYDNVPVRAKTQSTSGNRIIYGNFYDRHTSPISLDFSVGVGSKYTLSFPKTTNSDIKYPNHTLKQNRNYQVGIILSDRYGRSTDVILSKNIETSKTFISSQPYSNNQITFGNSTVYNPYFDDVNHLKKSNNTDNYLTQNPTGGLEANYDVTSIKQTLAPRAGIIDWPGDSLKIKFEELIPDEINLSGYPGLYTSPIVRSNSSNLNNSRFTVVEIVDPTDPDIGIYEKWKVDFVSSGPNDQYKPGQILQWTVYPDDTIQYATIVSVELTSISEGYIEVVGDYTNPHLPPQSPTAPDASVITAYDSLNSLGFYSYRFVVKQNEQSYYNVYLPSLLQGNPIPKPYKLFLKKQTTFTKILEVDDSKHPTPGTFPILEGQRVEGDAYYIEEPVGSGNWVVRTFSVVVTNIINDFQFEVSESIKVAGEDDSSPNGGDTIESDFTSDSNGNTLNVSTLLTDNANKVPPALNETTPVQQQYSTSTTRLIPRIAINNLTFKKSGVEPDVVKLINTPPSSTGDYTRQIYPDTKSLKVRSIGNFEAMFVDGKYAGLWQADTDPPTVVIENTFRLGRDAQTALPINKEQYQAAVYETNPTISNLEIFFESSTSGKISDLNEEIRVSSQDSFKEIEFFNSFWLKRIKTSQPPKSFSAQGTLIGSGTSPSRGVWPLSQVQASPQTEIGPSLAPGTEPVLGASYGSEDDISSTEYNYNNNWYLEESRIKGGFNNKEISLGARAFLDEEEPIQQHRFNSLIYSGVFNSRTGINRTNQFPVGTVITKSANPEYGSIQKIYAEETNLLVFQENKCQRALIDKDTIYTAEGGTQTQSGNAVIGQITPYAGEYGISRNPESFAIYSYQKYFIDRNRNAALRLSHDGITEISEYGMRDWFRDNLADLNDNFDNIFSVELDEVTIMNPSSGGATYIEYNGTDISSAILNDYIGCLIEYYDDNTSSWKPLINDSEQLFLQSIDNITDPNRIYLSDYSVVNFSKIRFISKNRSYIVGGWDVYNKQYICSLQYNKSSTLTDTTGKDYSYHTLGFDEKINGWPSFYTYRPGLIGSLKNKFYSVNNSYDTWENTGIGDFGIYEQYKDNQTGTNRGVFYGNSYPSTVTIIANANPSVEKNFLTIDYEGSSGWKVVSAGSEGSAGLIAPIFSDQTGEDFYGGSWQYHIDKTNQVYSFYEGQYDAAGNTGSAAVLQPILHVGFDRKENRYVANLVNSSDPSPGEVIYGDKISGIKGYYNIVTMSTDSTTSPGAMKELYQVGLSYNISSM